jgi:hypothetical protein
MEELCCNWVNIEFPRQTKLGDYKALQRLHSVAGCVVYGPTIHKLRYRYINICAISKVVRDHLYGLVPSAVIVAALKLHP